MSGDVFAVLDLLTGYQQAAVVTAAARLGVFDVLSQMPLDAATVAARLGTEPLATRALLDALAALGLASAVDGYTAVPLGRRLARGGDLRLVAEKEAFFAEAWLGLADSVRTGMPRLAPWRQRLVTDPEQARDFLAALLVLAAETGPDLTQLPGLAAGARVADFGGGLGSYAVPLAETGAHVTVFELEPVAVWARGHLAGWDRIVVEAVDLLAPDAAARVGSGYDVVLLSHLLHDLSDDECDRVLALARAACRPGGQVVVFELPGDPPGAFGPLFDLMMRVETPGRARRAAELIALLRRAGLSEVVESAGYRRPHGVFTGTR